MFWSGRLFCGKEVLGDKEVPVLDGAGVVGQWLGEVSARWAFLD